MHKMHMNVLTICLTLLNKLARVSERKVEEYGARYIAFGIFSTINYMIPMYMWSEWHANDVSVYAIRIIAIILSFMLTVSDSWYDVFKKYRPLFWHFTVMFCLPFLVTFMTIFDGLTLYWIVNINIAVLFGIILLDFSSFIVIYSIGAVLGILVSFLLGHTEETELPMYLLYPYSYMVIFLFVIVAIFARDLSKKYNLRLKSMRMLAASITHEIRTPLSTISLILHSLDFGKLPEEQKAKMIKKRNDALKEVGGIFNIIDVTLTKLAFNGENYDYNEELCATECVNKVLADYPFFNNERERVHIIIKEDFYFRGSEVLITHVIFNLLQNALYQIRAERRGDVYIVINKTKKRSLISVKDTASGIKSEHINQIFKPFVTNKKEGTGVGLYFCKSALQSMNADIYCQSVYGKYAEFIVRFNESW